MRAESLIGAEPSKRWLYIDLNSAISCSVTFTVLTIVFFDKLELLSVLLTFRSCSVFVTKEIFSSQQEPFHGNILACSSDLQFSFFGRRGAAKP
jgi:hypothetical protein